MSYVLSSMLGGAVDGMINYDKELRARNEKLEDRQAERDWQRELMLERERMAEAAEIRRDQRQKANQQEERDRIKKEATGYAEKRGGLVASAAGLDDAEYRGEEGIGVNVQKGQAEPTTRDFLMAKGDYGSIANLEQQDKRDVRQDKRDAVADDHWLQTFKHNQKQLQVTLANAKDAALERQEKRADKKAVRELYDKLQFDVDAASSSDDPKKYMTQINRTLVELKKYGEDASQFVYGKMQSTGDKVSTKTEDGAGNETTVTKDVKERIGGVLPTQRPSATGKPFDIKPGVNGEYVMKDGKRFFVPYKQ